ncbi:hypothetical protein RhiirA5_73066 [Rhizophagus irregularis]|uniref:Uncharacterized protein n=1 Tax=Rhizophagus irregularis TaxID=588596 RepID=A0A2I1EPE6_9GLOM|nr:hypothetical protein RhiirA5_73066 [Rhizophagus irregularis]PKC59340.1 hypothetical protein RhiirA1_41615 [Rhizophagus irregularis]PKY24003.1 hypothetical protein RhiirB3_221759 [Rhizophagus irregularis]
MKLKEILKRRSKRFKNPLKKLINVLEGWRYYLWFIVLFSLSLSLSHSSLPISFLSLSPIPSLFPLDQVATSFLKNLVKLYYRFVHFIKYIYN